MFRWARHRGWLAAATFALLWHALAPLSSPLLAQARAAWKTAPELAAICHGAGSAAVQPGSAGNSVGNHDHCPWCRIGGSDAAPPPAAPALGPSLLRHATALAAPRPVHLAPVHRPAHARGPPVVSLVS